MTARRTVTVSEADLLRVLPGEFVVGRHAAVVRLRAALAALGPEPCGHPSQMRHGGWDAPWFRCVLPKSHHEADEDGIECHCCNKPADDPIHSGDGHMPPADVWAES